MNKKFITLILVLFTFVCLGSLREVYASDIIHNVNTADELKTSVRKSRYSFDTTTMKLQNNIVFSGDLDLGKQSLILDLNYCSLSFINSNNGIVIDTYSWSKIVINNGLIYKALDSNSALFPKNCYNIVPQCMEAINIIISQKVDMQYLYQIRIRGQGYT